jgi:hypothetical protein
MAALHNDDFKMLEQSTLRAHYGAHLPDDEAMMTEVNVWLEAQRKDFFKQR